MESDKSCFFDDPYTQKLSAWLTRSQARSPIAPSSTSSRPPTTSPSPTDQIEALVDATALPLPLSPSATLYHGAPIITRAPTGLDSALREGVTLNANSPHSISALPIHLRRTPAPSIPSSTLDSLSLSVSRYLTSKGHPCSLYSTVRQPVKDISYNLTSWA